ncbi:Protein of unknown function [Gryllus bimaculatus]|nr:Protein of unknown function [Gryllus bimaculatus]
MFCFEIAQRTKGHCHFGCCRCELKLNFNGKEKSRFAICKTTVIDSSSTAYTLLHKLSAMQFIWLIQGLVKTVKANIIISTKSSSDVNSIHFMGKKCCAYTNFTVTYRCHFDTETKSMVRT